MVRIISQNAKLAVNTSDYLGYFTDSEDFKIQISVLFTALQTALNLGDAALLDIGTTASTVAAGNHNHTGVYAASDHNHNSAYAAIDHNHDLVYAPISLVDTVGDIDAALEALLGV